MLRRIRLDRTREQHLGLFLFVAEAVVNKLTSLIIVLSVRSVSTEPWKAKRAVCPFLVRLCTRMSKARTPPSSWS